jgi:PilZ domain
MRRLRYQQRVQIHLENEDEVLGCRVARVEGALATLNRTDHASAEVLAQLIPAAPGLLVFDHRGITVALKGIATASTTEGLEVAFVVTDGVTLPERRANERVPIQVPARVFLTEDAACIETATENVSLTGALVEHRDGLDETTDFRLELRLDPGLAPIRCGAAVARRTPTHVGVQFTEMQATDRARLAVLLREHAPE